MDITGTRQHHTHRVTLDSGTLATRLRQEQDHRRSVEAPRVQRQLAKRAGHPQHRQPRVRLGKPTGPDAFVHWQDYLDIADLHKMPVTPVASQSRVEEVHHETVSEMIDRYRGAAQNVSEKINQIFHDSYIKVPVEEIIEPELTEN